MGVLDDFAAFADSLNDNNEPTESATEKFNRALRSAPALQAEEIMEFNVDDDPEVIAAVNEATQAESAAEQAVTDMQNYKASVPSLNSEAEELLQQIKLLQARLNVVDTKRAASNEKMLEKRREVNEAQRRAEQKKRDVAVARQKAEQRKKILASIEGYQRIAQKMDWYNGTADGFKALPHQWEGMQFLASAGRAILGDTMGLGKTLTSIGSLDLVGSKRALVITPADVTSNFLREVKKWAPHRKVVNIKGMTKNERNHVLSMAAFFEPLIVIVNYEAWRKDLSLQDRLIDLQFDTVIADEAHAVKGTQTDAFSGVKKIVLADNTCPYCGALLVRNNGTRICTNHGFQAGQSTVEFFSGMDDSDRTMLSRSVKRLWLMTGTPILNAPEDLYPMLYLIDPIAFPHKSDYLRDYCELNSYKGKYTFRPGGLESLTRKLSGRYLARTLESAGVVLPPQDIVIHEIEFSDDSYLIQQDIIKQLTEHAQIVLDEANKSNAIEAIALITRQRQANVWPGGIKVWDFERDEFGIPCSAEKTRLLLDCSNITESIKIDKVMEIIDENRTEGVRFAVFSQFKTGLAELQRRLNESGITNVRFDGDTPNSLKERVKTNFDKSAGETPEWEVVLCNYKTGGVGLNLTAATQTIILDEEWNPGKRDQAYARTQRMGQDENTVVHLIRVKQTVDTWLAGLISAKEETIAGFDQSTLDIQKEYLDAIRSGAVA